MAGINKIFALVLVLIAGQVNAQMTSGKIIYERKVNLKKLFKDNEQVKRFLPENVTYRIEDFELVFSDSVSAFTPVPTDEPDQGFMKYLTTHNKIYTDLRANDRTAIMDMWGQETIVKDTIAKRVWKITDSKRKFDGYMARKAFVEINDSTRLYAWFTSDIVPTVGPEGFGGLPGTILGLATEDGSMVYFAKKIEAMEIPAEKLKAETKGKDVYTKKELKALLIEKMGKWVKPEDLDAMFDWI